MRYYLGVDWADREHAVWVEDQHGTKIWAQTVAHTPEALSEWGRWLDEQRAAGITVWAGIERPDGVVVDFLLDHGVLVYPINPKALDRVRDRYRMSGAKSDPWDAQVAAGFVRTDHARLRPLQPSSEAAQELKGLTRDAQRQIRLQTRLLNQLTAALKAYYPRALEVCGDLTAEWARAFLAAYPTPAAAAALTRRRWERFAQTHRLSAARTAEIWVLLERPQIPVPPHVVRVKARLVTALLAQLATTHAAVETYREAIDDFFGQLPGAEVARSLPGGKTGITVPTLWAELGDAAGRWQSFRHLQAQGGAVPVTEASGQARTVTFRFACNTALRAAAHQLAFVSLTKSDWARAYYRRHRQRGHSHHAALRAVAAKWLKIIFVMWTRHVPYNETHHLATIARQQLSQLA
ncbi:MAG: transposase [Alphaproteobacteria bacterium]